MPSFLPPAMHSPSRSSETHPWLSCHRCWTPRCEGLALSPSLRPPRTAAAGWQGAPREHGSPEGRWAAFPQHASPVLHVPPSVAAGAWQATFLPPLALRGAGPIPTHAQQNAARAACRRRLAASREATRSQSNRP